MISADLHQGIATYMEDFAMDERSSPAYNRLRLTTMADALKPSLS